MYVAVCVSVEGPAPDCRQDGCLHDMPLENTGRCCRVWGRGDLVVGTPQERPLVPVMSSSRGHG